MALAPSSGAGADRNQLLRRDGTGEVSGLGESEGNEVRLLVSSVGEGARLRLRLKDALEGRLDGRTRWMLRCRGFDAVEVWEAERMRSAARGESLAAMSVQRGYGRVSMQRRRQVRCLCGGVWC